MPRPFGPAVHRMSANGLLQFDCIELQCVPDGSEDNLFIRDDMTNDKRFLPFPDTSADSRAQVLID